MSSFTSTLCACSVVPGSVLPCGWRYGPVHNFLGGNSLGNPCYPARTPYSTSRRGATQEPTGPTTTKTKPRRTNLCGTTMTKKTTPTTESKNGRTPPERRTRRGRTAAPAGSFGLPTKRKRAQRRPAGGSCFRRLSFFSCVVWCVTHHWPRSTLPIVRPVRMPPAQLQTATRKPRCFAVSYTHLTLPTKA